MHESMTGTAPKENRATVQPPVEEGHGYPMFEDSSGKLGGGFVASGGTSGADTPGVLVYVTVDSIERILEEVSSQGGRTVRPRTEISPEVGWWASFRDPAGNVVGLFERVYRKSVSAEDVFPRG
jgi:predicted enzyme related to lactoylglutathione lyase